MKPYLINQGVSYEALVAFVDRVHKLLPRPGRVGKFDAREYAKKLYDIALICAEVKEGEICSAAIGYVDNLVNNMAYITLVGTMPEYQRFGYASKQIIRFIDYCKKRSDIVGVHIYCVKENKAAYSCYKNLGFVDYSPEDEPRPDDCHLVYWLDRDCLN